MQRVGASRCRQTRPVRRIRISFSRLSVRDYSLDPRTRCDPLVVGLELHTDLVVVNPQIAVAASHDRFGHERLHLLRHNADIGSAAAVISKAIDANTVVETTEEDDVMA
jgi:hypothetical protein